MAIECFLAGVARWLLSDDSSFGVGWLVSAGVDLAIGLATATWEWEGGYAFSEPLERVSKPTK